MVSVIVPVYNSAEYLYQCVDSIIEQTYKDLEIILIDDGSTDESGNICDLYAEKDSRIHVFHQQNEGPSKARNIGTRYASGEYITYVDSDDVIHPEYVSILLDTIISSNADIAVCEHKRFSASGKTPLPQIHKGFFIISGRDACNEIVNLHMANMIVIWGKLYKSKFRSRLLLPEGKSYEDEFASYKLMFNAGTVAKTNNALYYYRQRENSLSKESTAINYLDKLEALLESCIWLKEQGDFELQHYAQKRYLLSTEIAWSKVYFEKASHAVLDQLKATHSSYYSENKQVILSCCNTSEKTALLIFRVSPILYSFISRIYLKLKPES